MDLQISNEAEFIGRYLLGSAPNEQSQQLYQKALTENSLAIKPTDQKLLRFIDKHRWSLGLIDSGLALINPQSEIRRRIYFMFAILECQPEYCRLFLPQKRKWPYLLTVAAVGIKSAGKALLGILLIKVVA